MAGCPGRKCETHWISVQRERMWWSLGDMLLRNWWRMPIWFRRLSRSSILTRPVSRRKKGLSSSMKPSKQGPREQLALEEGAAVFVALGLDLLGEPPAAWHPVVWFGKLIRRLERAAPQGHVPQLLYGVVML